MPVFTTVMESAAAAKNMAKTSGLALVVFKRAALIIARVWVMSRIPCLEWGPPSTTGENTGADILGEIHE